MYLPAQAWAVGITAFYIYSHIFNIVQYYVITVSVHGKMKMKVIYHVKDDI